MRFSSSGPSPRAAATIAAALLAAVLLPATARAQYAAPELSSGAVGEKYHVELTGSLWNPALAGSISSSQFGQLGSTIDFVSDLGFTQTRFKDMQVVLRASKKSKFIAQYTPVEYTAETTLNRQVVFNDQKFLASLPIHSDFQWKVWRFGYEYDFTYRSRGFVGMVLEARYTQMAATLVSPIEQLDEYTIEKAPLPALGLHGRAYLTKNVAVNFQVTGFKLPNISPKYQANYYDWNVEGTANVTNNLGVDVGWRRMTTYLDVQQDIGNLMFQGMWFGATVRY